MEHAVGQCIEFQPGNGLGISCLCVGEHVVPLQELVEHDTVHEAPQPHAYRRYTEGRAAHWLLLIAADRVDAWESHLKSFATLRPDNPVTETGIGSEFSGNGLQPRTGKRVDVDHSWMDPVIVAGPWVLAGLGAAAVLRALRGRR